MATKNSKTKPPHQVVMGVKISQLKLTTQCIVQIDQYYLLNWRASQWNGT